MQLLILASYRSNFTTHIAGLRVDTEQYGGIRVYARADAAVPARMPRSSQKNFSLATEQLTNL